MIKSTLLVITVHIHSHNNNDKHMLKTNNLFTNTVAYVIDSWMSVQPSTVIEVKTIDLSVIPIISRYDIQCLPNRAIHSQHDKRPFNSIMLYI